MVFLKHTSYSKIYGLFSLLRSGFWSLAQKEWTESSGHLGPQPGHTELVNSTLATSLGFCTTHIAYYCTQLHTATLYSYSHTFSATILYSYIMFFFYIFYIFCSFPICIGKLYFIVILLLYYFYDTDSKKKNLFTAHTVYNRVCDQ